MRAKAGAALLTALCLGTGASSMAQSADTPPCVVGPVSGGLLSYQVLSGTSGALTFSVRCTGTQPYLLRLTSETGPLTGANATVRFMGPLVGSVPVTVLLPDDLTVTGERTFSLPLRVDAGQWQFAGGTYTAQLGLSFEPVGAPQTIIPAPVTSLHLPSNILSPVQPSGARP